jgi:dimethylaniline monooxygenase (N-oxide forming)
MVILGFSCLPETLEYPHHLSQAQFREYLESYANHFNILGDVVFGASVKEATRNEDDTKWRLDMLINGKPQMMEFDKVAFCHGYQTKPVMPKFEGNELFEGTLMHGQQFRESVFPTAILNVCKTC